MCNRGLGFVLIGTTRETVCVHLRQEGPRTQNADGLSERDISGIAQPQCHLVVTVKSARHKAIILVFCRDIGGFVSPLGEPSQIPPSLCFSSTSRTSLPAYKPETPQLKLNKHTVKMYNENLK